jgi:hypothetical protein
MPALQRPIQYRRKLFLLSTTFCKNFGCKTLANFTK